MPILTLAVLTLTTAQILDLGTFVTMVRRLGLGSELNPIVAGLVGDFGLPMAAIIKVTLIAVLVAITLVLGRRSGRVDRIAVGAVLAAGIVAGIVGGATNALTIGRL